jgi:hypothetical protein
LRLCSSAVGALSGVAVRNTAVPGTRGLGLFSRDSMSESMGVSSFRVLALRILDPRRQVSTTIITRPPIRSGTQPPWNTLSILAVRKVVSMKRKGSIKDAAAQIGHFQTFQTTTKAIAAVTTMVAVTAMP